MASYVFNIIVEASKKLSIRQVLYDRWQSIGEMQRLREMGIEASQYSPRWQDFLDVRNDILSNSVLMPRWEKKSMLDLDLTNTADLRNNPLTHFAAQCATVREVGRKVVKYLSSQVAL